MSAEAVPPDGEYVIKTYRYLRLSMVFLVAFLGVAVLGEGLTRSPGCWETSISSYYYTPVRAVFVGVLIAVGVCLVVLKGNTEHEDVLLNLAGMMAFVVPLVPTPALGTCRTGAATDLTAIRDNISNNVFALLVVGYAALAWTLWSAWRSRAAGDWNLASTLGAVAGVALLLAATGVFAWSRDFFVRWAHDFSAIAMFLCLIAVMGLNALGVGRSKVGPASLVRRSLSTGYAAVGVAMVLTLLIVVILRLADVRAAHLVLWLEAALIVEFAAFWVIQTKELWARGVRAG